MCIRDRLKDSLKKIVSRLLDGVRNKESADVIISIREYIEKNYDDSLNVADLARKYGLNVSYLSTLFKERTGINITSYIEGIRMEKAMNLLRETNWKVTEVAFHVGYSNSGYF